MMSIQNAATLAALALSSLLGASQGPRDHGPLPNMAVFLQPDDSADSIRSDRGTLTLTVNPGSESGDSATSLLAAESYWDLGFEICKAPTWYWSCPQTPLKYEVWVTNHGNVTSPSVPFMSGLVQDPGPGDWSPAVAIKYFNSGPVLAGQTKKFSISYAYCGANRGTQYLKAEINYKGGGQDPHGPGNNFHQREIMIK